MKPFTIIGIVGSIASLISIPLAIYFYLQSEKSPRLRYYVHPVKAVLLKAGLSSKLSANFEGQPINGDVTTAQISFWNQGNQSIRDSQILKPIVICTENNSPILEASIRKISREITTIALKTEEAQKGRVSVTWRILEPGDGGVIQLTYLGDPEIKLTMDGAIENQKEFERVSSSERIRSPEEQFRAERNKKKLATRQYFVAGAVILICAIFLFLLMLRRRRFEQREHARRIEETDLDTLEPSDLRKLALTYVHMEKSLERSDKIWMIVGSLLGLTILGFAINNLFQDTPLIPF